MKTKFGVTATVLALAIAVPVFAGGDHCGASKSTTSAQAHGKSYKSKSAAWAGAWLKRSADGQVTVAEVAKGSTAARAGLKSGDIVLAVNGYDLANTEERVTCASKASCSVGSAVTYTVQRGSDTKDVTFKLEKMPANATQRFAARQASFDPALAAAVMSSDVN